MGKVFLQRWFFISAVVMTLSGLLTLSLVSCNPDKEESPKTVVAVTLLPQAGFVEAVGGDKVEVVVMVPPGASPHTYEVTPDQMTRLSDARMYAKVGSPVEFELAWMDKLIAVNKSMLVVDCSRGIQLMEMVEEEHEPEIEGESDHEHEGLDPHIWLSATNAGIMVQNICDGLVQIDTANKAYYEENCAVYLAELKKLDDDLAADLSDIKNRNFIVFHPSFGYFARDYNLNQMAVEQGGKEPDAEYLVRLIEKAKKYDIKVVFISPQYSIRSAESIAKEIGGEVVTIDPLSKNFIDNMRAIKTAMMQAMQ